MNQNRSLQILDTLLDGKKSRKEKSSDKCADCLAKTTKLYKPGICFSYYICIYVLLKMRCIFEVFFIYFSIPFRIHVPFFVLVLCLLYFFSFGHTLHTMGRWRTPKVKTITFLVFNVITNKYY